MAVEETGKWTMNSCTAAQSTVAGDHASVRMAAAGSSYMEGEQLPDGRIDLSMSTGQEQAGSYDPFGSRRGEASSAPEARAEAASTKILSGGNKAMFRVPAEDVKLILSLGRNDLPSIDYLDDLAELYTPEEIAERKLRHQSDLELFKRIDDDFEEYQKKVRDSVDKYGYFEVDYDYNEARKKINAWTKAQWAKIKEDVNITVCAPDADQATLGYIDYADSDDDDASESEYDDDSESEDEH